MKEAGTTPYGSAPATIPAQDASRADSDKPTPPRPWHVWADGFARFAHALHGTRALSAAVVLMFLLVLAEPFLQDGASTLALSIPTVFLAVIGLSTLPREGVAVQDRVQRVLEADDGAQRLLRHAILPGLLVVLLLPRVFLAAYGIPHLSPATGLLLPSIQYRIALVYLSLLLWFPLLALRRTRRFAPDAVAVRPALLPENDPVHSRRDALILLGTGVVVVWVFVLRGFWQPFSLLAWPPNLVSLQVGGAGLARLLYVTVFPAALFLRASAYAQALGVLVRTGSWRTSVPLTAVVGLHLLLVVAAAALHLYDLLWIVQYQQLVRF